MKMFSIGGKDYKLPNGLNSFQQDMYVHLINWKWAYITYTPGTARKRQYDAIIPEKYASQFRMLYPGIKAQLQQHKNKFPFRVHTYFNHMASSQAANINLFLPVLTHPHVNAILNMLNPDFSRLAKGMLDNGYRIEFWDEPYKNLNDKTARSGTDSDIAIAYYNHQGELCLWLIEHKLTEDEFTKCGGFKSKGRQPRHDCSKSFAAILKNKNLCYYHNVRHFKYWDITGKNASFYTNHAQHAHCPFQGGMNQLWRNQLLALSIEQDGRQPYKHTRFSVVKHPKNTYLDQSLHEYQNLIAHNPRFSIFTSEDVINAAVKYRDPTLDNWIDWYKGFYNL